MPVTEILEAFKKLAPADAASWLSNTGYIAVAGFALMLFFDEAKKRIKELIKRHFRFICIYLLPPTVLLLLGLWRSSTVLAAWALAVLFWRRGQTMQEELKWRPIILQVLMVVAAISGEKAYLWVRPFRHPKPPVFAVLVFTGSGFEDQSRLLPLSAKFRAALDAALGRAVHS